MFNKLALTLVAAAVGFAQPHHGMGRQAQGAPAFTEIKAYLGLSDAQVTSITASNKTAMEANKTLMEQMRTKQKALQTALESGSTDATAIGQEMLQIHALRKQATANRDKAHEQAVSFLSAEQKTKLTALESDKSLRRELRQAHFLNLLSAPAGGKGGPGGGPGFGPRGAGKFRR